MTDLSKQSDTLGFPAFVPARKDDRHYLHNQRLGKVFIKEPEKIDLKYLHYLLCSSGYRQEILASATGTTVKHTSPDRIKRFKFVCPSLFEQRAIAHILGTLDDKIELNRKMNETLEAMARGLFKSWFVDFDPVRAKVKGRHTGLPKHIADLFPDSFEDSELGDIPKGWEIGCVDDEFDLTMGQSPPGESYNNSGDGIPFYQGCTDFTFRFPERRVYCTAPTRFAKAGDTLISVRAPVGDINMASEDCTIGRGVAAARHKTGSKSYTYQFMHGLAEVFERFEAEGTVFGCINKKDFHDIPCVIPKSSVMKAFEGLIAPLDDRIEVNEHECGSLAALRDSLLPRLISGELRVKFPEHVIGRIQI
jgi:type I restriction enzyme S subunit